MKPGLGSPSGASGDGYQVPFVCEAPGRRIKISDMLQFSLLAGRDVKFQSPASLGTKFMSRKDPHDDDPL